jgi:quinol monooxygenase YgiN
MVHATIKMVMPAKEEREVLKMLRSIAERTRVEEGCMGCFVYQSAEGRSTLLVEEFWKTEKDLECHLRSDEYQQLLLLVEMSLEPPEIRFNVISHTTGLETIEKARNFIPEGERS